MQADGGNYCASVNAATLAIIDAGIPLKDYVCACSAGFLDEKPVVDINYIEESSGAPELIVAILPKSEQIVLVEMNGRLHEDHLNNIMDVATQGCQDVYNILDRAVRDHVTEVASSLRLDTWTKSLNPSVIYLFKTEAMLHYQLQSLKNIINLTPYYIA